MAYRLRSTTRHLYTRVSVHLTHIHLMAPKHALAVFRDVVTMAELEAEQFSLNLEEIDLCEAAEAASRNFAGALPRIASWTSVAAVIVVLLLIFSVVKEILPERNETKPVIAYRTGFVM